MQDACRDMQISDDNFVGARNFSNKIWNVSRFVLTYIDQNFDKGKFKPLDLKTDRSSLELCDEWVLLRYHETTIAINRHLDEYNMAAAARELYHFIWDIFCDWYIELAKTRILAVEPTQEKIIALKVCAHILDGILRLAHPFMPFITEEIWKMLNSVRSDESKSILLSNYPTENSTIDTKVSSEKYKDDGGVNYSMGQIVYLITAVRKIRSEMNIPPGEKISIYIDPESNATKNIFKRNEDYICQLGKISTLKTEKNIQKPAQSVTIVFSGGTAHIPLTGLIDFEKERLRLEKDLLGAKTEIESLSKRLSFPDFRMNAPAEEVQRTEQRKIEAEQRFKRIEESLASIR
jgi:valyl-tRNA synthetase